MTEEAKKAQAEYYRQWRKKHPEKVRKYNETYWKKRLQKMLEDNNNGENSNAETIPVDQGSV